MCDPDVITEADIDYGYSLILAEMEQADIDAREAREDEDHPAPVQFGVRGYYTNEEW